MNIHLINKQLILLTAFTFFVFSGIAQKANPGKAMEVITGSKMKAHIDFLASDELLGRNTPSPGLDTAAAYIARTFAKFGVQPVNGSFFHPVPLVIQSLGNDNFVEITSNGTVQSLKIKTEFVPYEISANGEASGQVVFAGYGITAPEYNYDDYANIDVRGKIVVVMRHEPGEDEPGSVFKGIENTQYAFNDAKAENAIKRGAVGLLIVTDPLNHQMITPRGFPWPSLSRILPDDALPMTLSDTSQRIPVVHVGKEVINLLFESVDSLKSIQRKIDSTLTPMSREFPSISVKMKTSVVGNEVKTNNIIGIIPGTDPKLKNEYVIVGAHYDHVGFIKNQPEGTDYIINGADDNASGTAGLLAVAEAFSAIKIKPKRSVLLMAFSAEEKGLFGSEAYVRRPIFPLANTVAMLNMDMISRNHIDSLDLEGANVSPDLVKIVQSENKGVNLKISLNKDEHVGGSDHASFYKKNIPFLFFFAGLHSDYHTVRDNPDSINPDKAARISRLVFKTTWYIANDNKRYRLLEK